MKKIILTLAFAASFTSIVFSQTSNIESAVLDLSAKSYESAKKYIDKAYVNEETKNSPKMHYYRGYIHLKIANDSTINSNFPDACEIALRSFIECIKLDTKKKYEERMDDDNYPIGSITSLVNSSFLCNNKAANLFGSKDYDGAMRNYELILEAIPYDKGKDLAKNNLTATQIQLYYSYAAINARNDKENAYKKCKEYKKIDCGSLLLNLNNTISVNDSLLRLCQYYKTADCEQLLTDKFAFSDKAKNTLTKMIAANYPDPIVYIQLEQLQLADGDTTNALLTIEKGLSVIENNKDLMNEELRIYQARNDMNGLIAKLSKSIEVDPTNVNYILTRGNLYDRHKFEFLNKKKTREADSCSALAEADYLKCIEINANDTFALYSLGALYLQQGNPIIEKINALNEKKPDYTQKLNAFKADLKKLFEKAKPFLEKSYELKQDDYDIVFALQQLYIKLDMKDKAMEFKKKKEALTR